MQKTRHLMDINSVYFQTFLTVLSFITLGSENQISVFKQCQSNTQMSGGFFRGRGGVHAQKPKFGDSRFFSEKKLHKALCSVQFLTSFISFYFEILSYLACGEKRIRLASKNSVKLGKKSTCLVISSLSDMLQETLFLLTPHVNYKSGGFTKIHSSLPISLLVLGAKD